MIALRKPERQIGFAQPRIQVDDVRVGDGDGFGFAAGMPVAGRFDKAPYGSGREES